MSQALVRLDKQPDIREATYKHIWAARDACAWCYPKLLGMDRQFALGLPQIFWGGLNQFYSIQDTRYYRDASTIVWRKLDKVGESV